MCFDKDSTEWRESMFNTSKGSYSVKLDKVIEKFSLKNLTPEVETGKIIIRQTDVNRPALQFAGYFEYFDYSRIQLIGKVEYSYLKMHEDDYIRDMTTKIFEAGIPCVIFCRGLEPNPLFIELGNKYGVPVLWTKTGTSSFLSELNRFLKIELAPRISIHGVLVDVFGEGVLITGESGIGKSEAALELVKRGHRLVSDDVVEIKKTNDDELIGTAPDITRYFIELRGIGIIDVKTLYGVQSVEESQKISLVIKLEEWNREREYDRLGLEEQYEELLGNKVVCHSIPIRPGRNLAIIVETAAINYRQKQMGYNAAHELYRRVTGNLQKKREDEE
jgi:HPr kinase/phosphorylase